MYKVVLIKDIYFTSDFWYRVGIYTKPANAATASAVLEDAFAGSSVRIQNFASIERATLAYPHVLPASALIPYASELAQMVEFYQSPPEGV